MFNISNEEIPMQCKNKEQPSSSMFNVGNEENAMNHKIKGTNGALLVNGDKTFRVHMDNDDIFSPRVISNQGTRILETCDIPFEPYVLPDPTFCSHCDAKKFYKEAKIFCCSNGQIKLCLNYMPIELCELYLSNSDDSFEFRNVSRTYNNHFAFTSFGVKYDKELCKNNKGIYTFRVQAQVYYVNDLLPSNNEPSYLQLYFYDTEHEIQNRLRQSEKFNESTIKNIIEILRLNSYSQFFRSLVT